MRAPVYRNIEAPSTLLGLSFPFEVSVVVLGFWATMTTLPMSAGTISTLAIYAAVRLSSHGRPPLFLQHFVLWHLRGFQSSHVLSAAARGRIPPFPFASWFPQRRAGVAP